MLCIVVRGKHAAHGFRDLSVLTRGIANDVFACSLGRIESALEDVDCT